jgi:hypothetical protein
MAVVDLIRDNLHVDLDNPVSVLYISVVAWLCLHVLQLVYAIGASFVLPKSVSRAQRVEDCSTARHFGFRAASASHHLFVGPVASIIVCSNEHVRALCAAVPDIVRSFPEPSQAAVAAATALVVEPVPNNLARAIVPITLGYMIYDLACVKLWTPKNQGDPLLWLHHLISMVVWPLALVYRYCDVWLLLFCAYEVSTGPLTMNAIISSAGMKKSALYALNGTVFTFTFFVVRICTIPLTMYALWFAPPWAVAADHVPAIARHLSRTIVIPMLLNVFWWPKIASGYAGAVRGAFAKPASKKAPQQRPKKD